MSNEECPMCGAFRSQWRQPVIAQGNYEVHSTITLPPTGLAVSAAGEIHEVYNYTLPAYTLTRGSNAVMPPIIVEADPISEATE